MTTRSLTPGLASIADTADVFFLDIFGVLHDGVALFPTTLDCLSNLKQAGKTIALISNIPLSGDTYANNGLAKMGLHKGEHYHEIITAGDSAISYMRDKKPKKIYFAAGQQRLDLLTGLECEITQEITQADIIINGISGLVPISEDTLHEELQLGLQHNIEMLCANPDLVVHIGEVLRTCAGTHALWYEQQGGHVSWHGKPYEPIYNELWHRLGKPDKSRILAVGDSLRTDVAGAATFGVRSVWNLAGIHREEVLDTHTKMHIDPALVEMSISAYPAAPNFVVDGFSWRV